MSSFVSPADAEVVCVENLKLKISTEHPELNQHFNDTTILRFLRGQKNIEDKAYEALIKYARWRMEEDVDNIFKPETIAKFQKEIDSGKAVFGFHDLNGRPASMCFAHRHNANDRDIYEVKLLTIWILEGLRKLGKPEEERFVICFDLSQFTLACMDYEATKQLITILQANYPDTLETLYIIDAPMIFSACWLIIKAWLDPVTSNKVQFVKRKELEEKFAPGELPVEGVIQTQTSF
mmetsp:Transcript_32093/g.54122  ORF Transcript_32093/g.54122 Transcript_32093/m.54122 type:complete len:236 (-) Transcript_32093:2361-3068(-)